MPIREGRDSKGKFIQWGNSGAKYYYHDKKSKAAAYKKAAKQAAAAKHSGYKGNDMKPEKVTANISGKVRYDEMEGRPFLVAPMIMLTEGVHNGSRGPLFYPKEELKKVPAVWNHKPIVVYHFRGGVRCDD